MKRLLFLFVLVMVVGCSDISTGRYSVKEFSGEVRYDNKETSKLYLQFYSEDFKDYCEIRITDGSGQHKYHSESDGYGFPYTLHNQKLTSIIPLSYTLVWNQSQVGYDRLEGGSPEGDMYATLLLKDFDYIDGAGTYTNSRRCQAITQKGTQCKRNAERGRIYCWQHP